MSTNTRFAEHVDRLPSRAAAFAVMAVGTAIAVALILYLSRGLIFFWDEWDFVFHRQDTGIGVFLRPHNEHLAAVSVFVYKTLLALFGIRTYVPYMAVLLAFHAVVGWLMFLLLRRRNGVVFAVGSALLMLFLGSAWEDLLWAFQVSTVASAAFGLLAFVVFDAPEPRRGRVVIAWAALLMSIASSGFGLAFVVAWMVERALDPATRRFIWIGLVAVIPYVGWFVANAEAIRTHRDPLTLAGLLSLPAYLTSGLGAALSGLAGLGNAFAPSLIVAAAVLIAFVWLRDGGFAPAAVAGVAGVATQFALTGLVRSQFGAEQATSSRYVYTAAIFLLLFLSGLAGRRLTDRRGVALVVAIVVLSLAGNVSILVSQARIVRERAAMLRAELAAVELLREAPDLDRGASPDPSLFPFPVERYLAAVDTFGSPNGEVTLSMLYDGPPAARAAADRAVFGLSRHVMRLNAVPDGVPAGRAVEPVETVDAENSSAANGCVSILPRGADPQLTYVAPSGSNLTFRSERAGETQVFMTLIGDFQEPASLRIFASAGETYSMRIADLGSGFVWRLRFDPSTDSGTTLVCLFERN